MRGWLRGWIIGKGRDVIVRQLRLRLTDVLTTRDLPLPHPAGK
jgi:hypothetical protein